MTDLRSKYFLNDVINDETHLFSAMRSRRTPGSIKKLSQSMN